MTPEEITLAFSGDQSEFTPIIGNSSHNAIIVIIEILTPLLLKITYNEDRDRENPHTMGGIITTEDDYTTGHGLNFVLQSDIKSYDLFITKDMVEAERRQKTTEWAAKKADRR